ncbi:MAG: NlpC/P60 family protein [Bacteroidales bacterium]|nr:NlpC/P60 family protein [Clostridium sp.]MCM1202825.1 NlpC/P60 family protein [Bacteroidales bacterium]
MKKNIARGSMLFVAALSLMLGGTSYPSSVKEQVSETPVIVSKAIKNSVADAKKLSKGVAVSDIAENTAEQPDSENQAAPQEAQEDTVQVEEKRAKVESNQVVANIDSYLNIRSDANEDAEVVGKFYTGNVGTIVEKGDQWSLVSSGNAYGYVNNDYLLFGEAAEQYIENNCDQIAKVTADTLNVRAEESTDSEVITLSDEGDALTILGKENGWVKVAVSEEEVGYVASDYVYIDYIYETAVTLEEEEAAVAAEEQRRAEEAEAQTTQSAPTETPVQKEQTTQAASAEAPAQQTPTTEAPAPAPAPVQSQAGSTTGQAIANFAVQYVGYPYVYGGTSLTNGADCSGFVQTVFANFGYSLPRVASDQANAGSAISVDSIQPGDLLFYHGFGHVAIYIGGGQVVHASNAATGIKISAYNYSPIDRAVRIVW